MPQEPSDAVFEGFFRRTPAPARIGFFSLGHYIYWPQFPGLRERLMGYHDHFRSRVEAMGVEVVDAGMSESPASAREVGAKLRAADVDLLVGFLATYTPSADCVPIAQAVRRPLVLGALQPERALDYEHATTFAQLANDNITSLPEICCALGRVGLPVADAIVGLLYEDERAWSKIASWVDVARVLHVLRVGRIGAMGHVYEGMLDMTCDPTLIEGVFGPHVEHIELDDLQQMVDAVEGPQEEEHLALIRELFRFPEPGSDPIAGPVDEEELRWAARVSLGMHELVDRFDLDGLAYYYRGLAGNPNERLGCSLTVGSSLLTGRGVPIAGELDVKNCVAMLIMDRLGAGGSFAELHPIDFDGDFVLVGHDGPHHIAIAEGRPVLRGLSVMHGKRGRGPGVEFSIRNGPITMLGITESADGRYKLVVAEGQSVPGTIPATGNTNTRAKFAPDVRTFLERWSMAGPTHHFALGVGHHAAALQRLAMVLGLRCEVIAGHDAEVL